MRPRPQAWPLACAGVVLLLGPAAAHAAQSYDNCTGFIDSLPATISMQGVWCLRHNLGTNIASGNDGGCISSDNLTAP